jgi:adenosylcobinamide-GDP ribazoletransferase
LNKVRNSWQSFVVAMQFLSRVPMGKTIIASDKQWAQSVYYYPLVGAVLGVILATLSYLLNDISTVLAAIIVLTVWVAFTGALHIDGLADCSDGWVGGQGSREKTLAIMKDPAAGPIAVVVIVLVLLLKFAALTVLLSSANLFVLLIIPLMARTTLLAAFIYAPYANPEGIGAQVAPYLSQKLVGVWLILSAAVTMFFLPLGAALMLLLVTAVVFWLWRAACINRLQGVTGDCMGALVEVQEVCMLLTVALLLTEGI